MFSSFFSFFFFNFFINFSFYLFFKSFIFHQLFLFHLFNIFKDFRFFLMVNNALSTNIILVRANETGAGEGSLVGPFIDAFRKKEAVKINFERRSLKHQPPLISLSSKRCFILLYKNAFKENGVCT